MNFFSVVVPTYNNADKIERTIKSVLTQTFREWELIIIDDGSKDNTEQVIQPLINHQKIKYYRQTNSGVSSARNHGASKANGDFLVFLDSDDELTPNCLLDYKALIDSKPDVGFCSGAYITPTGNVFPRLNTKISTFRYLNIPGSFTLKRLIFDEIKGYDTNLSHSENWELTARALAFCECNDYKVLYHNKFHLIYHFESFAAKNFTRSRNTSQASLYLYKKYFYSGVLHFHKNTFLLEAAVNSVRISKMDRGRMLFKRSLKEKFSFKTIIRLCITYIPFLRRKIWMRKST